MFPARLQFALGFAATLTTVLCAAQAPLPQPIMPQVFCQSGGKDPSCNGISAGMPKIFDNRSLTLQLESLQKVLKQQQTANPTIDLKSVLSALANTQGLSQSELSTVLSILANPTPATKVSTDVKGGNVDSNGKPLPDTTDTQTSKDVASVTPAVPTFDSFAALPAGYSPTYGPSASDLLNDQVNLSYQIINLQMILERALSDRLYANCASPTEKNCTRLQAVVGFNLSIDPSRVANDAVAVVEITLTREGQIVSTTPDNGDHELSLVAMMPQEKTYNSAALNSSSHAYSGAAVVNAFQLSGGYRKRNQTFYVYRDTDTLAYERMTKGGELVFGWMFRPVLGRRSVSPGFRQLFAVISLPQRDCDHDETHKEPKGDCSIQLKPVIRTYWKKYDRATQTSFEAHDANRARNFWYGLSATLAKPQIFGRDSYLNVATYNDLKVRSSAFYEEALRPQVQEVSWHATGEKSVLVSVTGRNFFTSTQVKLGDTTYSEDASNLVIKSDQSFDLLTTIDQLTAGPGSILGRYGLSVPIIQDSSPVIGGAITDGFQIEDPKIGPSIDGYRTLDLSLVKRVGQTDQYRATLSETLEAQRTARELVETYQAKVDALNQKKSFLGSLKPSSKVAPQAKQLQSDVTTLSAELPIAKQEASQAEQAANDKQSDFQRAYGLDRSALPHASYQGSNTQAGTTLQSPIVSVNGNAVRMPYVIADIPAQGATPAHVAIHASFPDSAIDSGAAWVKVSWPFYNPDRWTYAKLYTDPDDQFKVDRVSAKTILIRREGSSTPAPGFDSVNGKSCWTFVAGDTAAKLFTANCPYQVPKLPPHVKGKPAPKPDPGPVIQNARYVASVTVGEKDTLPSHAVLLDPDQGVYHLTIPEFTDKRADTAAKPIAMKQNDSAWIKFALPTGKTAKSVEANGTQLVWREIKAEKKASGKQAKTPPQTIEVEITRALTAKGGSVDVSVLDSTGQSVSRQTIQIACSQCSEKKGDQQ